MSKSWLKTWSRCNSRTHCLKSIFILALLLFAENSYWYYILCLVANELHFLSIVCFLLQAISRNNIVGGMQLKCRIAFDTTTITHLHGVCATNKRHNAGCDLNLPPHTTSNVDEEEKVSYADDKLSLQTLCTSSTEFKTDTKVVYQHTTQQSRDTVAGYGTARGRELGIGACASREMMHFDSDLTIRYPARSLTRRLSALINQILSSVSLTRN